MKWAEISIDTTHEATDVVANIFHDLGASGVVIEDPELINAYRRSGVWEYCDIPEALNPEVVTVKAYLPVNEFLDDKLRAFRDQFEGVDLGNFDRGRGDIRLREIQDEDWATSWKQYYHPVKLGERVVIKPSWEEYQPEKDDVIIELDPGMAFGTGTHITTSMCIQSLEEIIKAGDHVFDIGTGSGILAITAAKLGAEKVLAVDFDEVAVKIAKENVAINNVDLNITVTQGDLLKNIDEQASVIIANIVADIIIKLLPDIPARLNDQGIFLASGIIADRLADVTEAMLNHGLIIEKVREQGDWAAVVARKGGS